MLIAARLHDGIRSGTITMAFRAWKRPTVVAGGTLTTAVGVLGIDAVETVERDALTAADARAAGYDSLDTLLADVDVGLRREGDRRLYRIRFHRAGDDPRITLRQSSDLTDADRSDIDGRLDRWDRASRTGPWTRQVLALIGRRPEIVSTELAVEVDLDKPTFKRRVRQLKQLGLTESLEVGYRLSPRGRAYLDGQDGPDGPDDAEGEG